MPKRKSLIAGVDYPGISLVHFCHDGKGNFLMHKRGQNARDEHGSWDIGGGELEFGDFVIDRLRREILQEYLTNVLDYEYLGYRDVHRVHKGKLTHWVAHDFKVLVDRKRTDNGEPNKFDEVGWFNKNRFPSPLHSQFPGFLDKYRLKLF